MLFVLLVAAVLGGWQFAAELLGEVRLATACVRELDGSCTTASGAVAGSAPELTRSRGGDPGGPFDRAPQRADEPSTTGTGVDGVRYGVVRGRAFITGRADGTAAVHPNDVAQGQLGDCGLIASIAAVALGRPEIIERMIRDNGDGSYTVTLHERREGRLQPVEVTVTSEFPLVNGFPAFAAPGDFAFDGGRQMELWPMIIEKAFAQQRGGYGRLEAIQSGDALEAMTGQPSESWGGRNLNALIGWSPPFDRIAGWLRDGHAVTAGTIPSLAARGNALFGDGKLQAEHAYYVTAIDPRRRTITVRNPQGWGHGATTMTWDEFQSAFVGLTHNPVRPPDARR